MGAEASSPHEANNRHLPRSTVGVFLYAMKRFAGVDKTIRGDNMGYKNHEGYSDPTAGIAEKNIEKQEKKHNRYLRYGKGYPARGYRIGELYCFRLCVKKMGYKL